MNLTLFLNQLERVFEMSSDCIWGRRCLGGLLLAVASLLQVAVAVAAPRPPAEAFFERPAYLDARISPDGGAVAVRMLGANGQYALAVIELLKGNKLTVVAYADELDVIDFEWLSDQRLILKMFNQLTPPGQWAEYPPGLFAVNRDASQFKQLSGLNSGKDEKAFLGLLPWHTEFLRQLGGQDSEYVHVTTRASDGSVELFRLNTLNRRSVPVDGPNGAQAWWLDAQGLPRLVQTMVKDSAAVHYLDPSNGRWRKLVEGNIFTPGADDFTPITFGPDGKLYVYANKGQDKAAVFGFDLGQGQLSAKPLFAVADYSFAGGFVRNDKQITGLRYLADTHDTHWFDARMKALQQAVDALLPTTTNTLSVGQRSSAPFVLVASHSDQQPELFWVYNSETERLSRIGASRPKIKPAEMGVREVLRYPARDGLPIPALLTLPPGVASGQAKNLPLVVLVHGGPYLRGSNWGWDGEAAFLASRGYAVLQPEFRGSTGFGDKHFKAGWKQWGLAMQDDIADGARWAIAKGIADPKRICIAGASYGGYATLMGLIKDPDLYRCGINWVGVTDIALMYGNHWLYRSDFSDEWKQYGMPVLVGDLEKDAAQLQATSPIKQAHRLKQPLLLAYGRADQRVPLHHGLLFRDAVQAGGNQQVEWVEYEKEGHGWVGLKTQLDFWGRVERFLEKNIGK